MKLLKSLLLALMLTTSAQAQAQSSSPASHTFTAATFGYGAQTPQQFTITNNGAAQMQNITASFSGSNFEISAALSATALRATCEHRPLTAAPPVPNNWNAAPPTGERPTFQSEFDRLWAIYCAQFGNEWKCKPFEENTVGWQPPNPDNYRTVPTEFSMRWEYRASLSDSWVHLDQLDPLHPKHPWNGDPCLCCDPYCTSVENLRANFNRIVNDHKGGIEQSVILGLPFLQQAWDDGKQVADVRAWVDNYITNRLNTGGVINLAFPHRTVAAGAQSVAQLQEQYNYMVALLASPDVTSATISVHPKTGLDVAAHNENLIINWTGGGTGLAIPLTFVVNSPFAGDGSNSAPYLINNLADLIRMRDLVNTNAQNGHFRSAHYRVTANIDMASQTNWTPIGNTSLRSFNGVFDGGGYTISNLTITGTGNWIGLFGNINHTDAVVRNVALENVSIIGNQAVGGIAGWVNAGIIENNYVSGIVVGNRPVGGIVGSNVGTVRNNYATASVSGHNSVGGIVGESIGTVENNVALNPSIRRTGGNLADFGRVVGLNFVGFGTLTNNYAWHGMQFIDNGDGGAHNFATGSAATNANNMNGASIFAYQVYDEAFWADKGWTANAVLRDFSAISHLVVRNVSAAANPLGAAGALTHYPPQAAANETVTLTQTPNQGFTFTNWTSEPAVTFTANQFTMGNAAVAVKANYAPYPLVITGGEGFTYTGGVLTIRQNGTYTIANRDPLTPTNHRIVVAAGVTARVTLNGVNIAGLGINQSAFLLDNGANVTLMLADGSTNTLTSGNNIAGITAPAGTTLTIDGAGTLFAIGGTDGAGIGGGNGTAGGNITILGGNITATGGVGPSGGAGIGGGGRGGAGGNIRILGGNITATGGVDGAGIGGGGGGGGGNILIYGENTIVTATRGHSNAQHIGAGRNGAAGSVFVLLPQENLKTNNPSAGTPLGNAVHFSATPNASGTVMLELPAAFTAMGFSPLSVLTNPTADGRVMSAIVSEALNASDFEFSLEGYANSPIIKRGSALRESGAKVDFVNLTPINWTATANGSNATASTTEITLTFDVEPVGLTVNHISVTGASKGTLTGSGLTRTLAISNISVNNGAEITVEIMNFGLFDFIPKWRNVVVYRDITPPTAQVQFHTNGFEPFVSSPDFKRFFRNSVNISISANDESGIAEVSWVSVPAYLGEANAANLASVLSWTESTVFTVFANQKFYLYVRVTDNHGNIAYFGTEGIVVFTDAQATASADRTLFGGLLEVPIAFNSNTVAQVRNGETVLTPFLYYSVEVNQITFRSMYLDDLLGVGTHTLTVHYNPLGEAFVNTPGNDAPGTTVITVTIYKAQGADVSSAPVMLSKTYNSITVNAVSNAGTSDQTVEYAISTSPTANPNSLVWQDGTTFVGLESDAGYWVFARTKESATHLAGPSAISAVIYTDPKTWTASVSPNPHDFPSAVFGYNQQAAQQFTITNTGNQTLTGVNIDFVYGFGFEFSSPLSSTTIPPGETATFSVRPTTGLPAGTGSATDEVGIGWDKETGVGLSVPLSFTVNQRPIASASIHVVAPVKAQTPNTTATPIDHHNAYTAGAVSWTPNHNPFLGSTSYTATVTLTADNNHSFTGLAFATINGQQATTTGNIGTEVTLSYQFAATQEKQITALTIESQPSKLVYTHGDALDLNGLSVRIDYSDTSFDIVPFSMLSSFGVSTIPAHGDRLTHVANHGKPVVIEAGALAINTNAPVVNRIPVTITGLSVQNKVYDGDINAVIIGTPTIEGKLPEDEVNVVMGTASFSDANAGIGKTVMFSGFGLTGIDAGNYLLQSPPAAVFAEITPAPLTISGFHISKVYDGTTDVVGSLGNLQFVGLVGDEFANVSTAGVIATYTNANVGTGIAISFSGSPFGMTGGTANPNNYMIVPPSGITGTISAKPVAVVWSDTNFTFNGLPQAPTAHIMGVGGDIDLSVSGEQTDAGTWQATASFEVTNDNYLLNNATTDFTIAAKPVDVVWTNTNLVFDGTAQKPTAHIIDVSGGRIDLVVFALESDAGTHQATADFHPMNANYVLINPTANFTISAKPVDVVWTNTNLVFDGTAQKPTAQIMGVSGVIDLSVSGAQTTAGIHTATASFVPANDNYLLINPTENFTISPKPVNVIWTNTNLVFDGTAQAPTAQIIGVSGVIDLSVSGEQTVVGNYIATASFVPANANYLLINPTANFTISPKAITISGFNISKDYDGNTNVTGGFGNLQFVGLVNNETAHVDASAVTAVYASSNIGTGIAIIFSGNFAMTGGTADPNNYSIVQPTGITGEIIAHNSTNIYGFTIQGQTVVRDGNNFSVEIAACGINLLDIFIDTAPGSVAKIDGAITGSIQLNFLGNNHFEIVVTAPTGEKETYTLTVNKPVAFEQVALVRWGNTLTVINNPAENGGFVFTSFRWFKNGVEVYDGQSYTVCLEGEQINPDDVWRVELTADNISGVLRTCEASVRFAVTQRVVAYPNPVSAGATLWIETNATDSQLEGAVIDVYNLSGQLLDTIEVHSRTTAISINRYGTGTYIFVFRGRDGFRQELKIMVNR